jgi:hypothetical protein
VPITVTFDIQGAGGPSDHHRLLSMFERFGWERFGGTVYRYPRTDADTKAAEDWMNDVIPALMILRAYIIHALGKGWKFPHFTIDVQSSTGYNSEREYGAAPVVGAKMELREPSRRDFGKDKLREFVDLFEWPY